MLKAEIEGTGEIRSEGRQKQQKNLCPEHSLMSTKVALMGKVSEVFPRQVDYSDLHA